MELVMEERVVRGVFACFAIPAVAFAVGCGSSSPSAPSSTTPVTTPSGPTFSVQLQQQILTPACVPCHTDEGRTPSGGLNLKSGTAYSSLINVASTGKAGAVRVIPGNPSGSYIIQKLEGAPDIVGLRMPRNGPPYLTDAQVALIRLWIQNGAPNN
jgi:mono/diheme cytochrome c family protein